MNEIGQPGGTNGRRFFVAAAIAAAGPWALWLWQESGVFRFAARWWTSSHDWVVLASALAWVLFPFGHNITLGYGVFSRGPSGWAVLEFAALPVVGLAVFGWLTKDWTARGLRRAGWLAAAWVALSIVFGFAQYGIMAPAFDDRWTYPAAFGRITAREVFALPYLLGYVVWICPILLARVYPVVSRTGPVGRIKVGDSAEKV